MTNSSERSPFTVEGNGSLNITETESGSGERQGVYVARAMPAVVRAGSYNVVNVESSDDDESSSSEELPATVDRRHRSRSPGRGRSSSVQQPPGPSSAPGASPSQPSGPGTRTPGAPLTPREDRPPRPSSAMGTSADFNIARPTTVEHRALNTPRSETRSAPGGMTADERLDQALREHQHGGRS